MKHHILEKLTLNLGCPGGHRSTAGFPAIGEGGGCNWGGKKVFGPSTVMEEG